MRKFFAIFMLVAVISSFLTSCADASTREIAITAAKGPADTALPHHAVFAVNENADARLISAARSFCDRTVSLSNGGTVFNLVLSKNALEDLRAGKADAILLENAAITSFSPMSEPFRYKSYEHFSMTANSTSTLHKLSDILGANVIAGYYAGSNVFLSHGSLDSKFKATSRRNMEDIQENASIPVTVLEDSTAITFSLLGANVTEGKTLAERIAALATTDSIIELSPSELDSPALLQAVQSNPLESSSEPLVNGEAALDSTQTEPEQLMVTQAFTGIKPVWLVFAPSAYERLSQASRSDVAEAAAYMTADIDKVFLEREREKINRLLDIDVISSRNFIVTRSRALRLADEQDAAYGNQNLRGIISKIQ